MSRVSSDNVNKYKSTISPVSASTRQQPSYNKFVKKMFKEFREKHPNYKADEIMKKIGAEWRKKTNK